MRSTNRRLQAVPGRAPQEPPSDEDIMRDVALGDRDAFAVIYDRFSDRVYGLVRRVLRDPAQSEEVTQEVLVEAWRLARRFDPTQGSVATWLLTMAHRRAIDRVRSEQASRTRDDRVARQVDHAEDDPVGEDVERRLEHEQVRRALGSLTDLQREAIGLAYYGGNTYREVAEILDTPLGTVKTRLRDGLIRLRDELGVTA